MDVHKLQDMIKGWFVGDFTPAVLTSGAFEVAVKYYQAGEREGAHFHKVATELTVVIAGEIAIGGQLLKSGDIVVVYPGEATDFEAVTNCVLTIVKVPSVKADKYDVAKRHN